MISGLLLVFFITLSRLLELWRSSVNTKNLIKLGAREHYPFHYNFIVCFHISFILYFFLLSFDKPQINYFYLFIFLGLQVLRIKIISDLGKFWTTRIIVLENTPLIKHGIYKYFKHPNYALVFFEILVLCLTFNDLFAFILFGVLNTILLGIRIFYENKANKNRINKDLSNDR